MRTMRMLALALALSEAVVGCGGATSVSSRPTAQRGQAPGTAVAIEDFQFDPGSIEIERGMQVVWTNRDTILHTVTSGETAGAENKADGVFTGKLRHKGTTFAYRFSEPGTYTYFCSQHNVMNGTIDVKEAS